MNVAGWSTIALTVIDVADGLRGDDDVQTYLRKQERALRDMLAGRAVRTWRLDRLIEFCEALSVRTLQMTASPGCGTVRL